MTESLFPIALSTFVSTFFALIKNMTLCVVPFLQELVIVEGGREEVGGPSKSGRSFVAK